MSAVTIAVSPVIGRTAREVSPASHVEVFVVGLDAGVEHSNVEGVEL